MEHNGDKIQREFAGRVSLFKLLPFSHTELLAATPSLMKNSQTPKAEFFKGLTSFRQAAAHIAGTNTVVYAGADDQERSTATILSWKNLSSI